MFNHTLDTVACYTHLLNATALKELEAQKLLNQEEINKLVSTLYAFNKEVSFDDISLKLSEVESLNVAMRFALEGSNAFSYSLEECVSHLDTLNRHILKGLQEVHMMLEGKSTKEKEAF